MVEAEEPLYEDCEDLPAMTSIVFSFSSQAGYEILLT